MMKICSGCSIEKPIESFNFRNRKKGTRHSYCADCGKQKTRKHYLNNKSYYIKKARKHDIDNTPLLRKLKEVPCADCGVAYPYYVMDFDHLRNKSFLLSRAKRKGRKVLQEEIAKCEVVCANCHRERTHQRNLLGLVG